jgi:hypothetical protein
MEVEEKAEKIVPKARFEQIASSLRGPESADVVTVTPYKLVGMIIRPYHMGYILFGPPSGIL